MYKLIFYVPKKDKEQVKSAIFETGAGQIGLYSHCCWEVEGMGQFKPMQGSVPSIGHVGSVERVKEFRVELLCSNDQIFSAVKAMKSAHPYEEPAYEVISVQNHIID